MEQLHFKLKLKSADVMECESGDWWRHQSKCMMRLTKVTLWN